MAAVPLTLNAPKLACVYINYYLFTFSLKTGWSHSVKKLLYKRALYYKSTKKYNKHKLIST